MIYDNYDLHNYNDDHCNQSGSNGNRIGEIFVLQVQVVDIDHLLDVDNIKQFLNVNKLIAYPV